MKELFRTNDMVLLSFAGALLREQGIETTILDGYTSIAEGSIGALPRRMVVADAAHARAHVLLDEALRAAGEAGLPPPPPGSEA